MATRLNELWSQDISKLKGPAPWVYYYLYLILDVFSRCVAGSLVARWESATPAERLIAETCQRKGMAPRHLTTLHADRGTSMRSKPVALLLADLGVWTRQGTLSEASRSTSRRRGRCVRRWRG